MGAGKKQAGQKRKMSQTKPSSEQPAKLLRASSAPSKGYADALARLPSSELKKLSSMLSREEIYAAECHAAAHNPLHLFVQPSSYPTGDKLPYREQLVKTRLVLNLVQGECVVIQPGSVYRDTITGRFGPGGIRYWAKATLATAMDAVPVMGSDPSFYQNLACPLQDSFEISIPIPIQGKDYCYCLGAGEMRLHVEPHSLIETRPAVYRLCANTLGQGVDDFDAGGATPGVDLKPSNHEESRYFAAARSQIVALDDSGTLADYLSVLKPSFEAEHVILEEVDVDQYGCMSFLPGKLGGLNEGKMKNELYRDGALVIVGNQACTIVAEYFKQVFVPVSQLYAASNPTAVKRTSTHRFPKELTAVTRCSASGATTDVVEHKLASNLLQNHATQGHENMRASTAAIATRVVHGQIASSDGAVSTVIQTPHQSTFMRIFHAGEDAAKEVVHSLGTKAINGLSQLAKYAGNQLLDKGGSWLASRAAALLA